MNDVENVLKELSVVLGAYIKTNVPKIVSAMDGFPAANQAFAVPGVSIFVGNPNFIPISPYSVGQGAVGEDKKAIVKYCVGIYEIKLQLDLWTNTKEERNDLFQALFVALNPIVTPMGLSLPLPNYHNQLCRYTYVGQTIADGEEDSRIAYWRTKIDLLADVKAIIERLDYVITEQPEITPEVGSPNEPVEEPGT